MLSIVCQIQSLPAGELIQQKMEFQIKWILIQLLLLNSIREFVLFLFDLWRRKRTKNAVHKFVYERPQGMQKEWLKYFALSNWKKVQKKRNWTANYNVCGCAWIQYHWFSVYVCNIDSGNNDDNNGKKIKY